MTPLMFAAHRGNAQVVLELANRGANVNLGDKNGYTPLMKAASESQVEAARILLSHGAKVNVRESSRGRTPLMEAVFVGCRASNRGSKMVKLLLQWGADVRATDQHNALVLKLAKDGGCDATTISLLKSYIAKRRVVLNQ